MWRARRPSGTPARLALGGLGPWLIAVLLGCGDAPTLPDGHPADERTLAAYQCMPPAVQRTYVDLERRRVELTRELVREQASAQPEELEAAARADPRVSALTHAQGAMLGEYAPATVHGSCDSPP